MGKIVETAARELLEVIGKKNNDDTPSSILPKPLFKSQQTTEFISKINAKIGSSDATIISVTGTKDIVAVLVNYDGNTKGAIAFFDIKFNLYTVLVQWDTGAVDNDGNPILSDFGTWKIVKTNNQNILYGLVNVAGKVNFFVLSDIIELVGVIDEINYISETFFSTIFDIETEITKKDPSDPDSEDLKVKVGNAKFKTYDEIAMNQDAFDNSVYAFSLWTDSDKTIDFVKIAIDLNETQAIEATWDVNEPIKLSQGTIGTGSDFAGISQLGILTGEQTIDGQKSLGSLVFSTQKDAGQSQDVTTYPIIHTQEKTSYMSGWNSTRAPFNHSAIVVDKNTMVGQINKLKKIINSNPKAISWELKFKITGSTGEVVLPYDKAKVILDGDNEIEMSVGYSGSPGAGSVGASISWIHDGTALFSSGAPYKIQDRGQSGEVKFGWDLEFDASIDITLTRVQQVVQANTTSQITLENDGTNNIYKIVQSENNSYEGTPPVFISPRKVFIPLKKKPSGIYSIFEFNGTTGTQAAIRIKNDKGDKDYSDVGGDSFKSQLIEPTAVTKVNVGGADTTEFTLDKATGEVTILGITEGVDIEITYSTLIGEPTQVDLTNNITGEDVFIYGIADAGEISSTGITIIGAGDNSYDNNAPTDVFGFNLYRSKANIDYDAVAEEIEAIADFKIRHVRGFRQKDLLYIYAYNDDFSEVIIWTQIYPDSFKPYTYKPYENPDGYFTLERLNQNKGNELKTTVFDRELLDVGGSGTTVIASTTAEATDLNDNDNDTTIVYGGTNQPLFESDQQIIKERFERRAIQFTLNTFFKDQTQDKDAENVSESTLLANLFSDKNKNTHNLIAIDRLIIENSDGTSINLDAEPYLRIDPVDSILWVEMSIINRDKTPQSMTFTNANGDNIINIDLTGMSCPDGLLNIRFKITINSEDVPAKQTNNKGGH